MGVPQYGVGECGADEVVLRVCACAVDELDVDVREGVYAEFMSVPCVPGYAVTAIIEKLGDEVRHHHLLDEVVTIIPIHNPRGGYAQYTRVKARDVGKIQSLIWHHHNHHQRQHQYHRKSYDPNPHLHPHLHPHPRHPQLHPHLQNQLFCSAKASNSEHRMCCVCTFTWSSCFHDCSSNASAPLRRFSIHSGHEVCTKASYLPLR